MYFGKVKYYVFEDTLIPLFEKYGNIWKFTLMTDFKTKMHYGFVTYESLASAQKAFKEVILLMLQFTCLNVNNQFIYFSCMATKRH